MTTNEMASTVDAGAVVQTLDSLRHDLVALSLDIHAHPELNYEERHAAALLSGFLEKSGFEVERGVGGVETAFRATAKGRAGAGPTIGILVEYDALPGIGHGCGHNLIAMSTIGAGLGAAAVLDALPGTIVVLGTPAEEGGGGKIRLLDAGVFDGVDVALSSHPGSNRTVIPTTTPLSESSMLAMVGYRFEYYGRAAHAAAGPQNGVNALNAVIHLFTGIDALRQHLREDVRIHGIITDGGLAPNVVPEFAAADFMLRARSREYLKEVVDKVYRVAEGAALITGARVEIKPAHPLYENVRPSSAIAGVARTHAAAIGMELHEPTAEEARGAASTDLGNVSQVIPTYALRFAVSTEPIPGHSVQMREAAKSDLGLENALNTAKVLALTACDFMTSPELLAEARREFEARGAAGV